MKIALIGWGSLLWDTQSNELFDKQHGNWFFNGPSVKLEFARKSASREYALTLVLDAQVGTECKTAWCLSTRETVAEALKDLKDRESTTVNNIACLEISKDSADAAINSSIFSWGIEQGLRYVIWTALPSNFQNFSEAAAVAHVQGLSELGKRKQAEYLYSAPAFVQTPIRSALESLACIKCYKSG